MSIWKDIVVFLEATTDGERVGYHAATLAQRHGSHLVGVYGVSHPEQSPCHDYARGSAAIRQVVEGQKRADEQQVLGVARHFEELSCKYGITSEFRVVWRDGSEGEWAARALHCDLIVAAHPKPQNLPEAWSGERLVLTCGIPVLSIPQAWRGESIGDSVIVAWNGSREARRAVVDSMPFLSTASRVTVLMVDAERNPERFGEEPGIELLRHLTKHDTQAEIRHVQSRGAPIASVILSQALEQKADLLIMGAYSRPRTAELLFGSTTRALLGGVEVPFLMSR